MRTLKWFREDEKIPDNVVFVESRDVIDSAPRAPQVPFGGFGIIEPIISHKEFLFAVLDESSE